MRARQAALERMRAWIANGEWAVDSRIPAERDLADQLGISRGVLRLALATLESEGQIWRHVGKGTFVGPRPATDGLDLASLADCTSPAEVLATRLILEPHAARLAAVHAKPAQIADMRMCIARTRSAKTFQQYVIWDNRLHLSIAAASGNTLFTRFLETLHALRRTVIWGRLNDRERPSPDNPSLEQHDRIVHWIDHRHPENAAAAMYEHLAQVEAEFLPKHYRP